MLIRWVLVGGGFGVGGGVGGCDNVLDSVFFMDHLHWRDIGVDTLCTCGGTWVDMFADGSCAWSEIGVDTLCTHTNGKANPLMWEYIRSQQWRWELGSESLLVKTGQALAKLWMLTKEKTTLAIRLVSSTETLQGLQPETKRNILLKTMFNQKTELLCRSNHVFCRIARR